MKESQTLSKELSGISTISRATQDDTDSVWKLIQASGNWLLNEKGLNHWSSYYSREIIQEKIATHESYLLHEAGAVVGTITLHNDPPDYYSPEDIANFEDPKAAAIYISALAVQPESHGKGIASSLLRLTEAEVRKRGIRFIRFDCRAEYEDLVRFYEKRGYQKIGLLSESQDENYFLMEKSLSEA